MTGVTKISATRARYINWTRCNS